MPTRFGVGGQRVVDLARGGVEVVVVVPDVGDLQVRARLEPVAEARLAVLEDLDAGDRGRDQHVAAVRAGRLDQLAQPAARLLGGLAVVRPDEALRVGRHRGVGDDHLGPALAGAVDHVVERVGRVRRDDDRVRAARDRVLDELDLLVDVGLGGRAEQADVDAVVRCPPAWRRRASTARTTSPTP